MPQHGKFPGGRGYARAVSKHEQNGNVLFHAFPSDHAEAHPSFYGFRQHYTGSGTSGTPVPPPGLTRYPGMGPGWALKLSTADTPTSTTPTSQQGTATYKNLSQYFTAAEVGLIRFSGYFATMPGRTAPGSTWSIGIDHQLWGSTDRSFFKAQCRYSGDAVAHWYLIDNSGNPIQLANSSRITAGINQNKANFNYVELTVKLDANYTGPGGTTYGRGQYYGLQVNHTYFDLTDTSVWSDPTQSGQQAVQGSTTDVVSSADHYLDYDGGLNFGVFMNSPSNDASYPFRLVCSDLIATTFDA